MFWLFGKNLKGWCEKCECLDFGAQVMTARVLR